MCKLLLVLLMLISQPVLAHTKQVDPGKLDSLARSIENSSKAQQAWQDSFHKQQDSVYRAAMAKAAKEKQSENVQEGSLDEETGQDGSNFSYLFILIGFIVFVAIAILVSKRKQRHG